jgi:NodT family efflux transporter outer membrane factor (OMF) lipoprotein
MISSPRPLLRTLFIAGVSALSLSACAVGPDYRTPAVATETAFKEAADWTPITPMDALDRGQWWSAYHDPVLDDLERRVQVSNQTLAAQEAAYKQAKDALTVSQSTLLPAFSASASGKKSGGDAAGAAQNAYTATASASWTADVWGKVRRQVEAARATAQMSAADLANVRLSLQATLASDYFQLRAVDAQRALLAATVENDQKALDLTQHQYEAGVAARGDILSARSQLETAKASLADIAGQRAQLEHAIAVLVGVAPADFSLAPAPLPDVVPTAPLSFASTLLQRRPDIAAAERAVAAASAGIGVAKSAYFPAVSLTGSDGSLSNKAKDLFKAGTASWSYGAAAAVTLFDFGAREAEVRQSKSLYRQRLAEYRQTVLAAFANVEDEIAALRALESEIALRDQALSDAREAEAIALNQYRTGVVGYASVLVAQNVALTAAQNRLLVQKARLTASVGLIEALGGGWTVKAP